MPVAYGSRRSPRFSHRAGAGVDVADRGPPRSAGGLYARRASSPSSSSSRASRFDAGHSVRRSIARYARSSAVDGATSASRTERTAAPGGGLPHVPERVAADLRGALVPRQRGQGGPSRGRTSQISGVDLGRTPDRLDVIGERNEAQHSRRRGPVTTQRSGKSELQTLPLRRPARPTPPNR